MLPMQPQIQRMPGYRLNEYLLVLSPHEELRKKIMDVKTAFNELVKETVALKTRPHLSLSRFVTWNMNEERIVNRFQQIAMGVTPFKIELRDFGSFPTHTIFINVTTKLPVQELSRELRSVQRLMKAHPDHSPHFIQEPHISIARKLLPRQYEKGWQKYSQEHFTARFIADSMLLLKRPFEAGRPYEIVKRLDFYNMPVSTRQGELFA